MPTVSRVDGLRIVIYLNDHRPAHVHMVGSRGAAVFFLNCPDGPPELRESFGFKRADVNRIQGKFGRRVVNLMRRVEQDSWQLLNANSIKLGGVWKHCDSKGMRSLRVTTDAAPA